jgi:predicted membrane metal-binding protein
MTIRARTGVLAGASRAASARGSTLAPDWRALFAAALLKEIDGRRFFLWIPVAAMGGVALNLAADREPVLWMPALLTAACATLAWICRGRPLALGLWVGLAALFAGFLSMGLRTARVETPVLDHVRVVKLQGFVEEVDIRPSGARFIIGVVDAGNLSPGLAPHRVRVTTRKTPDFAAGDYVGLTARLWPPPRAALPGGYDFSRDAYFEGVGAVGSTVGSVSVLPPPGEAPWRQRFFASIDRARNRLAVRVDTIIGGDEGAIAAAMVTGKRDFLSNDDKDLIREAGIFHIITISGLQMTLVAGIFFILARRLLALSPTLALNYPIKKWAAGVAMLGSLLYDIATGSRVGTERALIMTLIVLGAVILDRRALTMRNLALAVLAIVAAGTRCHRRRQFSALIRRSRRARCGDGGAVREARPRHRCVLARARPPAAAWRALRLYRRQAAAAHACGIVRDDRHRLVHGLSFSRSEPLRRDRQSADAGGHRMLRRARRAVGDCALSARPRRAGLALCRPWHQVHSLGRALHRRRAGRDAARARIRALRASLSKPRRHERGAMAQLAVSRHCDSAGRARPHRRSQWAAL